MTPSTLWLTGLSGAGKTTLAQAVAAKLRADGHAVVIIDGDDARKTLSSDLGFSEADRIENVRRCAAVAELTTRSGVFSIVALMSPNRSARDAARALHERSGLRFIEIWLSADVATCAKRDTKSIYASARTNVIGVDLPYESPQSPELIIPADLTVDAACTAVLQRL